MDTSKSLPGALPEPIKQYVTILRCPLCNRELDREESEFIDEARCVPWCGYQYDFNAQRARIDRVVGDYERNGYPTEEDEDA